VKRLQLAELPVQRGGRPVHDSFRQAAYWCIGPSWCLARAVQHRRSTSHAVDRPRWRCSSLYL